MFLFWRNLSLRDSFHSLLITLRYDNFFSKNNYKNWNIFYKIFTLENRRNRNSPTLASSEIYIDDVDGGERNSLLEINENINAVTVEEQPSTSETTAMKRFKLSSCKSLFTIEINRSRQIPNVLSQKSFSLQKFNHDLSSSNESVSVPLLESIKW